MTDPSTAAGHGTTPSWSSAVPPRPTNTAATAAAAATTLSSVKPRIQIALPPVVSGRGRKKPTPASVVVAPRQPSASSSSSSSSSSLLLPTTTTAKTTAATTNTTTAATKTTTDNKVVTKKKSKKKKMIDWPTTSADYLPPLADTLVQRLQDTQNNLEFPINEECTFLNNLTCGFRLWVSLTLLISLTLCRDLTLSFRHCRNVTYLDIYPALPLCPTRQARH